MSYGKYMMQVDGVEVRWAASATAGFVAVFLIMTVVAVMVGNLSLPMALLTGLLCAVAHFFVNDVIHQIGHITASRRTGHPQTGVIFFYIFAGSIYPKDEPELPPQVHIRRALGGPIANLVWTIVLGFVWLAVRDAGAPVQFVAGFAFFDSLLFYTLGALAPLKIGRFMTDGATIVTQRRRM